VSLRAIALGVVDQLRLAVGDPAGTRVGYQPDGRPPPAAGETYLAVSGRGFTTRPASPGVVIREFTVEVSVTRKTGPAPRDRRGALAAPRADPREALLELAERATDWLVGRYDVLARADAHIPGCGVATNGFLEPFHTAACGPVVDCDGRWFAAEGGAEPAGLRVSVTVSGAARVHKPD